MGDGKGTKMNEFDRRKKMVGSGSGKTEQQYKIDAAYVLGANPNHHEGREKLKQLANDPDSRVRAAAREQLDAHEQEDSGSELTEDSEND
jgi:hypothetical protein